MDYCSTCRRHLNGALVCPGCGAYAPDIAPNATTDSAAPFAPGPAADPASGDGFAAHPAPPFTPPGTAGSPFAWEPTPGPAEAAPAARTAAGDAMFTGTAGTAGAMSAGAADGAAATADAADEWQRPGRAARRRQRARWKKTQRRALVATAVALVGGGLTVASLDRHTAGPAQAAPAPGAPHTDSVGRQPAGHTGTATGDADLGQAAHTSPARPSTPPAQQPPTTAAAPHDTATAQGVHPYSAAPHTTAAVPAETAYPSAPARQPGGSGRSVTSSSTSGSSGGSGGDRSPGTTTQQTQQTSQPATSDGSGSGTTQTSPSTTAPSQTSPSSTSSQQLCLLVICLG
ncbi:hypothetical protein ABZ484_24310 [Streptomyces sp. NPDC006393]|uniref:SCO2400 family protein n=1 Tax=Streptomyces sp. NPDC006393 TaxID=3156763 RepID=UPI0034067533